MVIVDTAHLHHIYTKLLTQWQSKLNIYCEFDMNTAQKHDK